MPLDALRTSQLLDLLKFIFLINKTGECILEFAQVFTLILHVKIPAMSEVYPDDSTILRRVKWATERAALRTELEAECEKLRNSKTKNSPSAVNLVVQNLVRIAMKFLTYKPVGRPHVFPSDAEWTLVSEAKLRFKWRKELLL